MLILLPLFLHASPALAATCEGYAEPVEVARYEELAVDESSGLAAARLRPGTFWTHDDSGSSARLFAFTVEGEAVGEFPVEGVPSRDWEDLAAGPCPAGLGPERCLYIGDIGDNRREQDFVSIYILEEPGPEVAAGTALSVLQTWSVRYPEGPEDAETLLVHPRSGAVDIVTKSLTGPTRVFRVPADIVDEATLEYLGELPTAEHAIDPLTTGGDWDADGERLVVRTYTSVLVWEVDPCAPDGWWEQAPRVLGSAPERQGEAATFGLDGHLYTSSEGHPMPLHRFDCQGMEPFEDCGETGLDSEEASDSDAETGPEPAGRHAAEKRGCGCGGQAGFILLPLLLLARGRRR